MTTPSTEVDEAIGDAIILLVLAALIVLAFADFIAKHLEAVVLSVAAVAAILVALNLLGRRLADQS